MNKTNLLSIFLVLFLGMAQAQILEVTPPFPTTDSTITVVYNATEGNGALVGVNQVYAHAGVITNLSSSNTDWRYVIGQWGTADSDVAMTNEGGDKHSITYNIRNFHSVPAGETVERLAFVFRDAAGNIVGREANGDDIFYNIAAPGAPLGALILSPVKTPIVDAGDMIQIEAVASAQSTLTILDNGVQVTQQTNANALSYSLTATGSNIHTVHFMADDGTSVAMDSFQYVINPTNPAQNPPTGSEDGITYLSNTSVRLQLYAPGKEHVYVVGSFNDYQIDPSYSMTRSVDGNTYWLEVSGLTAGENYTFQYLVDGCLKIADPYSSLILDPSNDQYITSATFPNMPAYPNGLTEGIVTVLQPGKTPYAWQTTNYQKPAKTDLVVYELLLRDFVQAHDYKTLRDSLDYLENLGINAIQLMPINEFEGNLSWGYNPSFHMALDKYYGSPDDFKALVDECHNRGIAIILDVVFNHAFSQSPLCQLYWDSVNFRPTADNPWLNVVPKHAFNVGYDFNHDSPAFRNFMDKVLTYWVEEYRIDGFRFDLSKGFTQTQTCDSNGGNCNVGTWSNYDASRVANIQRLADVIWNVDPQSFLILEHFATGSEEMALSNYGLMLWGNANCNYNQASMGYSSGPCSWDFNGAVNYQQRGWGDAHLIGYMESHDEERLMVKNLAFGNANGGYNIKNLGTALDRQELVSTFFYTIPGPKMLWQFGELGYDYSINTCNDGVTVDEDCRLDSKPIRWDYLNDGNRKRLYEITSALIHLRTQYPTFETTNYNVDTDAANKLIRLTHPSMNAIVLGNFGVVNGNSIPNFHNTGTWYEFFTGDTLMVTNINAPIDLAPGEYRLYTSEWIPPATISPLVAVNEVDSPFESLRLFPNPTSENATVQFSLKQATPITMALYDLSGRLVKSWENKQYPLGLNEVTIGLEDVISGLYFLRLQGENGIITIKVVKNYPR